MSQCDSLKDNVEGGGVSAVVRSRTVCPVNSELESSQRLGLNTRRDQLGAGVTWTLGSKGMSVSTSLLPDLIPI
jgi:hypothetical protein